MNKTPKNANKYEKRLQHKNEVIFQFFEDIVSLEFI
jgi:hypothetical protein